MKTATRALPAWLAALTLAGTASAIDPTFSDQTGAAGISYIQALDTSGPRVMSGGAGACDLNGDGHIDLYAARLHQPDILYLGDGTGSFSDGTAAAFPGGTTPGPSNGIGCADIDNDGDKDLMVTVVFGDRHHLFINNGSGVFSEEAIARGVDLSSVSADKLGWGVAFGDYDLDGFLDLYVAERRWDADAPPGAPPVSRLFHNQGSIAPGYFVDVTDSAGVSQAGVHPSGQFGFAPTFADVDLDGWPELVLVSDFGASRIYWNDGDGTFTDGTAAAGVGSEQNGMGSTLGDYDGDGDLDWFVTSIYDLEFSGVKNGNRLWRNNGDRTFDDETDIGGVRHDFWGWGTAFFDYDNDTDLDIVATNGWPSHAAGPAPMRLWRNDGASFFERAIAAGLSTTLEGRGLLVFDPDEDGDVDVFVVHNGDQPVLYRNDGGNANPWLRVAVRGTRSNRDGIGARVTVTPQLGGPSQMREIGSATLFLAWSELTAHFGLGSHIGSVDLVEVQWPGGGLQVFEDVTPNTTLLAVEPVIQAPVPALPAAGLVILALGVVAAARRLRGSGREAFPRS